MFSYEECKEIAQTRAEKYNVTINKAYSLGEDYVFDSEVECDGIFPVVVKTEDGSCVGLWRYVNENDMSMDDMIEREL